MSGNFGATLAAMAVASTAHKGQKRVNGEPYIMHPMRVANSLSPDSEAVQAGWLHDTVEDSDITLADLLALGFSEAVVAAVDAVSRREGETYMDMVRRAKADPLGRRVKMADLKDNLRDIDNLGPDRGDFQLKRYTRALALLEED